MAAITIRGLTKRYCGRHGATAAPAALNALDLEVGDGELLVLVGPSGCGKSTALRLIAGLEQPSAGSIRLGERELHGVPPQQRDVAMVFQGYALYPHLSVRDNIAFPLKMRRRGRAERAAEAARVAEMVGLSDKLARLPAELSGGERQRVAMARAMVRSPQAFLFDEPLSNLDAKLRAELRVELVALVRRLGTTAIYVTHDQAEAMTMGDRVAVLCNGALQQVGSPRQIYEDPDSVFVASFMGSPTMNIATLEADGDSFRAGPIRVQPPSGLGRSGGLQVGVRPEHLRLGDEPQAALHARAVVTAVEPLGAETVLHLQVGETSWRGRVNGFGGPATGSAVQLSARPEHLLWFAVDSGCRLRPEGSL